LGEAVFIGECFLPWKQVLSNGEKWLTQSIPLTDDKGKCSVGQVKGSVKVFAKWIPAGHPDSKYDAKGGKKDAQIADSQQPKVPSKREQLQGQTGMLEIYPLTYVHPEPLQAGEKFMVEMILLGGGTNSNLNRSILKPLQDPTTVNLKDIRTLPVNDIKSEKSLQLRLLNSKGVEIARTEIKTLPQIYISAGQMIELRG